MGAWVDNVTPNIRPRKRDQDCLDACFCLLVALHFSERKDCLLVGDQSSGYMMAPDNNGLRSELEARCLLTGRIPSEWVRVLQIT